MHSSVYCRLAKIWMVISMSLFWFVWGGYALDSWQYLVNFDLSPLVWKKEQLFWALGYALGLVVPDPWPIKIISVLISMMLFLAYYLSDRNHLASSEHTLIMSLLVLLVMPGYYLFTGNVVRQGTAAAIILLGVSFHKEPQRYWGFYLAVIVAFFFHVVSIVFAFSFLFKRITRMVIILLLASPFVSFISIKIAHLLGFDLNAIVPYLDRVEGSYYYSKFIAANIIAYGFLWVYFKAKQVKYFIFISSYIWLVIFSNALLAFEVPFERVLLFSNIVLPLALIEVLTGKMSNISLNKNIVRICIVLVVMMIGPLIWSHQSTLITLGYAN